MSRYSKESFKKNNEKKENYFIMFSKQNSLNRSSVYFPSFAFSELIDVGKYGCVRAQ